LHASQRLEAPGGACQNYFSIKHALDPFTLVHSFEPPYDWGDKKAFDRGLYEGVTIPAKELTEFDVHDFSHYLGHPSMHVPLFNIAYDGPPTRVPLIDQGMYSRAMEDYRQRTLPKNLQAFSDELEKLKYEELTPFKKLVAVWAKYKGMLEEHGA
jgi:hypothetical protein